MIDFAYPLAAIHANGDTIIAATPDEAAAFNHLRPGPFHVRGISYIVAICQGEAVHRETVVRHDWIVRDAYGATVLHEDLPRTDAPRHGWLRRRLLEAREAAERGLPIPGTGRRRRYSSGYRGFRRNATMRAAESGLTADLRDWGVEGVHVGRTRTHLLPRVWDDVPYRSGRRGGWKEHRATQWR